MAETKRADVLSYLESANMVEISELIEEIEEKFGVTATAPVAVAAAGPADSAAGADEDNTEFRVKVDAGHFFIYPGDNSGGVVDTMKASGSALSSGLAALVDITVDADTASVDVEVFVASV